MYGGGSLHQPHAIHGGNFLNEVTSAMLPAPELIYFYTHMDYQLMEVGQNKPTIVPEMILQIRLRISRNVSIDDGADLVQQIHRRLGIEAPLFASAWMVNGLKFEVMGQQARRSNPPAWNVLSLTGGNGDAHTTRHHKRYVAHLQSS